MDRILQRRVDQKREVQYPLLTHDLLPKHVRFDSCTIPVATMQANHWQVILATANAQGYLERWDDFADDLRYAIDISHRIFNGDHTTKMWYEKSKRLDFVMEKGLLKPTDFGSWIKVEGTTDHYLTVNATDFANNWEVVGVRHYISLDEHKRLLREKEVDIASIITKSVERGVASGVESAARKQLETLEETQKEKADIVRQMADLQRNLDDLNRLEREQIARQKQLEEQERLRLERLELQRTQKAEQERLKSERTKQRNRSGYVYILKQIGGTYYKIGRTNNPDNRLATFSVKLPFEVQYEHLIKTDDMYALEAELHARYAHCRVGGEFFALSPDDLAAIKGASE